MRNGQNKQRMRNRGGGGHNQNRRGQNPLTRVYESNGPEIKIRGTASHIAEKYLQLARDAQGSGDPVAAENYYQHAEHYFRIIAAAQEQFRQNQPQQQQQPRIDNDTRDDSGEDGDGDYPGFGAEAGPREPQPYPIREPQPYQNREPQPREQNWRENRNGANAAGDDRDIDRLPSFITGGQAQPNFAGNGENGERPNGGERGERGERGDRYPHRRRRRHHGQRFEGQGSQPAQNDDFGSGSGGD
jgi:hypothetical protein